MFRIVPRVSAAVPALLLLGGSLAAQLTDRNISTNNANAGIAKTLAQEVGEGVTDAQHRLGTSGLWPLYQSCVSPPGASPNASLYIIACDPFRSIRRGRQIFQRKFRRADGVTGTSDDSVGSLNEDGTLGGEFHKASGLADSCAMCHGRPRGAAGGAGDTFTAPDSRDSTHLFGLGLKEMLADEITQDLRATRQTAIAQAKASGRPVTVALGSKGIGYGSLTASGDGTVDTSAVQGVNPDLRVRQIFADGGLFSIREVVIATFKFELGLLASDPVMTAVLAGKAQVTPSGMRLDPAQDAFVGPPPVAETASTFPASLVDHMEFYLMNYFTAGTYEVKSETLNQGAEVFNRVGCGTCHIRNLQINRDRRVGDVRTAYDPVKGGFNNLYATVSGLFHVEAGTGQMLPNLKPFLVENIFTDFKRHDLGPNFYENRFDGGTNKMFLTTALWGVGSTAPYGHDGRSINLPEVILRHGGEAQSARDAYAALTEADQQKILNMLNALILFPPDDTASNLKGESRSTPGYPQKGHGAIALTNLFRNPADIE